jgi:hypothetical protein
MADNRAEDTFGAAADPAPPSNRSRTQSQPTAEWDALDSFLTEWIALDSFPSESDAAAGKPLPAETAGDTPSHEEPAQGDLMKELGEETIALKNELESLRVLAAQLTSDYQAILRIAREAQERSVDVECLADGIRQRLPSLAAQEDLGRQIDERIGVLHSVLHEAAAKTQMLETQKDTSGSTLPEAERAAGMGRRLGDRTAKLREGKQLRHEGGWQLAPLERQAAAIVDVPRKAHNSLFGAAAVADDRPQARRSHVRFAGAIVAVSLLIGVISFLVTGALTRPPATSVEVPTAEVTPAPSIDPPASSSEGASAVSPAPELGRDGNADDRSGPSNQQVKPGASTASSPRTGSLMGTLPGATVRENTSGESNDSLPAPKDDLSGWWMLTNRVERSSANSFNNLRLGFRLRLDQTGNRVRGNGVKWLENGRPVALRNRTPIVVAGTMAGTRLVLTFTERGARRTSRGTFEMELADDGSLAGRFSSDAARSSGWAQAVRMSSQPK